MGPARPGVRRALPADLRDRLPQRSAPLRGRLAPGDRGRPGVRRRGRRTGSADLGPPAPAPADRRRARAGRPTLWPALDGARAATTAPPSSRSGGRTRQLGRAAPRGSRARRRPGRRRRPARRPGRAAGPAVGRPHRGRLRGAGGPVRSSWWPTRGSGCAGMGRALRGAGVDHVIGSTGRAASRPGRCGVPGAPDRRRPGRPAPLRRLLGVAHDAGRRWPGSAATGTAPPEPAPDDECAVVFTSGATGPAKGVVYRHRQVQAQLDLLRATLRAHRRRPARRRVRAVRAVRPGAGHRPRRCRTSTSPRPGTLTAPRSPTRPRRSTPPSSSPRRPRCATCVATADGLTRRQRAALGRVRLLMSAGAPVPAALLRRLRRLLPAARLHTPYGMTEALPVTDVSLAEIEAAGPGDGVCVGPPAARRRACGSARWTPPASADGPLTDARRTSPARSACARRTSRTGYDALWATEQASSRDPGWHRTGDVGHLDAEGRLWVEGRLAHVITTADGAGHPGRHRAAGARRWTAVARPRPWSASGRPAPSRSSWWSSIPAAGRRRAGSAAGRRPDLADAVRAAAGRRRRRGAGDRRAAGRHPARLQGRPGARSPAGRERVLAGGAAGGSR